MTIKLKYSHGVFYMAIWPYSSKCWSSLWIAVLIFSSWTNPTLTVDEQSKTITENSSSSLNNENQASNLITTPSSQSSSSQSITNIVSTFSYFTSLTNSAIPKSTRLLSSSISSTQHVAMTTLTKLSSPGVDVSSFLTTSPSATPSSSYGVYVSSSQSSVTSSLPLSSISTTDTASSSQIIMSTRTSSTWHGTADLTAVATSSAYTLSSSSATTSYNTITTSAISLSPNKSISHDAMSSSLPSSSRLSASRTSVYLSSSFIVTPSPSVQQTSTTLSSTSILLPETSSSISSVSETSSSISSVFVTSSSVSSVSKTSSFVSSVPMSSWLPGIVSSSTISTTPQLTSMVYSKSSSIMIRSSITSIDISPSSSSAIMSTSIPVVPTTPPVKGPSSPPMNVSAYNIASTSMVVSWQPPPSDTLNGELEKYEVMLEKVAADACSSGSVSSNTETITSITYVTATLSSTTSPSSSVKLQISSSAGPSFSSSPEAMPSSTMQMTAKSSSIVISTTMPVEPTEPTKPTESPEPPENMVSGLNDAGKNLSIILSNLEVLTCYGIQVRAVTTIPGPWSAKLLVKTTPDKPTAPPLDVRATTQSSSSILVSWKPPPLQFRHGLIKNYIIEYYSSNKDDIKVNNTMDNATSITLVHLRPYTKYHITVKAVNSFGAGPASEPVANTTFEDVPTEPRDVKSKVINSTSLKVMWKAPNQLNGVLKFYQVSYRPKSSSSVPAYVKVGLSTSAVLTSLHPFTLYEIFVQAATARGLGPAATVYIATPEGVPGVISYLGSDDVMTDSVTIKWAAPAHPNGRDIGYRLVYGPTGMSKNHSLTFDEADTKAKIGGLVPYTNYTFTISAYNLLSGLSGPPKSITVLTLPKESSPPRNIRFVRRTSNSLSVSWDPPAQPNGEIDHYLLKVFDVDNNQFLESFKVFGLQFTIGSLKPYHEYSVSVSCQNNVGESESSPKVSFYTLPTTPPTIPPIKKPSDSGITENVITIELEKASDSNGKISYYQVIVLELAVNSDGDVIPPDENPDDFTPETLVTYVEAKKQMPKLIPYIAAQFPANFFSKYRHFKVGDGKNFSAKARKRRDTNEQFYNGPLSPSTFYTMFERAAVNKDIYTSSGWTEPVSTSGKAVISKKQSTQGTNVGLVAGVCVALVFLIVIAIILLMLLWKKRRFAFGMLDDEGDYSNRSFKLQKMRGSKRRRTSSRGLMGSTDSLDNLDDLTRRRQPIPVEEFVNHVRRMHIDGDIGFSEEYELVQPDDKEFTWQHSLMPFNKHKNRYANIVAYDHSRVLLTPIEGVAGSDYINANYIDGYSRSGAYIATQGPLPETFDDFWRMIWEQGTATIVMLTQLEERGRRKCDQYWPDRGTQTYGAIRVTASETSHMSYYVLRVFIISHKQDEEEPRQVKQYHFTSWPDHGVPTHPVPLLSLVRTVANANPSTAGPCVVHCSAGVGRTGTYVTLDSVLQRIEKEQTIDVFEFVQQMRTKRNLMVQTESQYIFIHDALVEAVSCGITEFDAKKCSTRIRELREVHPESGRTYMEQEFLRLLKDERHHSTFKAANMGVNSAKNRYLNILPYENTRVSLKMRPGEIGSDYINASYIDGYCRRQVYIATQAPLPGTFEDFWRMVWEQGSCVIVMLTREEEAGKVKCHRYWPSDGTRIFGDVLVELAEEVLYTDYIMREFKLTHTEEKDSRVIRHYQYIGWPDIGLPESGVGLIDLIGQIEKWQQQSNNTIITAHCSGGVGRTGVYCAISILIERVKAEGVIDVFQTVQLLRLQRPAMVQILEQYEFCYSTLQEYLDSFDLYANFH